MDTNVTLTELRELLAGKHPSDLDRVAELFEALDDWLSKGGFLPYDWRKAEGEG